MSSAASFRITRANGLHSDQVHQLAFDSYGGVWMATPAGLAHFNGLHVRVLDQRNAVICVGLRAVVVRGDDSVWIGTDQGLEAFGRDGTPIPFLTPWTFGLVESLLAVGDSLWVGTARGAVRFDFSDEETTPRLTGHYSIGFVRQIEQLADGAVVAVSAELGLVRIDSHGVARFRANGLTTTDVRCIAILREQLVVGTRDGVVFGLGDGEVPQLVPIAQPSCLTARGDRLWIASNRTIACYQVGPHGIEGPFERHELPSSVNDVYEDEWSNVWVATNSSGVLRWSGLRNVIEHIDLGVAGAVYSIKQEADGALRLGGDGFDARLSLSASARECSVLSTHPTIVWDSHGWCGGTLLATQDGLQFVDSCGRASPFMPHQARFRLPSRVLREHDDALWVGDLRGLVKLCGNRVEDIDGSDGRPLGYVYTLSVDRTGSLWVGTLGRGAWRLRDGHLEQIADGPLAPTGNVTAIAPCADNDAILVLQDERVIVLARDDRPRLVAELHPIAGWAAIWLTTEKVAIGSSNGLLVLDVVTGQVAREVNLMLGKSAWEVTNNRALVTWSDGKVYVGINGGLATIDASWLEKQVPFPAIRFERAQWRGGSPALRDGVYRIAQGRWGVAFKWSSQWPVDETVVEFRYQLAGFGIGWSPLSRSATAHFTSLPPGKYELWVQSFTPLTRLSTPIRIVAIEVTPNDRQDVTTPGLVSHEGSAPDQSFAQAVEVAVRARTHALHHTNDELRHRLSLVEGASLTDYLTQIGNRRDFDLRMHAELERAKRDGSRIGVVMIDIDFFKLYNDTLGHEQGDRCLREVAKGLQSVLRPFDTLCRYGGEEFTALFNGCGLAELETITERLRAAVHALNIEHQASEFGRVTVSVGATSVRGDADLADALRAADRALYRAKKAGRNGTVVLPFE